MQLVMHVTCMSCRFMFGSFWIILNVIFCPGSCRWQSFQQSFHTRSCNGLRRSETPVAEKLEHEITLIIKQHRTCKRFTSLDKELYWINGLYIFIQLDKNYTRHTDTAATSIRRSAGHWHLLILFYSYLFYFHCMLFGAIVCASHSPLKDKVPWVTHEYRISMYSSSITNRYWHVWVHSEITHMESVQTYFETSRLKMNWVPWKNAGQTPTKTERH